MLIKWNAEKDAAVYSCVFGLLNATEIQLATYNVADHTMTVETSQCVW